LTQRLKSFFALNPELRQLAGKVQQLRIYQSQYEQVIPLSLSRASHVLHLEHGQLILSADNGAIGAKLRQMVPELIQKLQQQGCEVTGIQVRVQVTLPPATATISPALVSAAGKQKLNDLAAQLNDSPLKSALLKLAGKKTGNHQ
jgi:hypothetical protein